MSFNQVENIFLSDAIDSLMGQFLEMGGTGYFGLGRGFPTFMKIMGSDGWQYLGVAKKNGCREANAKPELDPAFIPVKYWPPQQQPSNMSTVDFYEKGPYAGHGGYKGIVGQPMASDEKQRIWKIQT